MNQQDLKVIEADVLRMAFYSCGGEIIYEGISGSYSVEKKYCAAFEYLENFCLQYAVEMKPMPKHPREFKQITQYDLEALEADIGILFSMLSGCACVFAERAFR